MKKLNDFTLDGIQNYLFDVLGSDPEETRPENYLKALQGIGIDGVRNFITSLLENEIPASIIKSSYFHPNKFFKLGICRLSNCVKLRIHFWDKHHLEAQTPIHSHAWDYASLLLSGSYLHETFQVHEVNETELAEIEKAKNAHQEGVAFPLPGHYLGLYKIPKRDESSGKFQPEWNKYVRVERQTSKIEKQGKAYFLSTEYPHQITINLKEVGSLITLVLTSITDRKNLFTLQPIHRNKTFDNPSPNVDHDTVKTQLKMILQEMSRT